MRSARCNLHLPRGGPLRAAVGRGRSEPEGVANRLDAGLPLSLREDSVIY